MPLTEAQIAYEREPIPYTLVKRLERGPLYVRVQDIPHPIYGYSQYHKEYSVIDLRGYFKGHEPRLEILGVYTPNPNDLFRIGTGRLPPYQPIITGDKLQADMERLGTFHAWRILPEASAGTHPLIIKQYPLGEVPEKIELDLEVPIPPLRGTKVSPKTKVTVPENAALRTNKELDRTVEHLGYQSISLSEEEVAGLEKPIPTDVDIINASQRSLRGTESIPDDKLNSQQQAHLILARAITKEVCPTPIPVYAAIIPPASARVRTAGIYGTATQTVYIALDQLYHGRTTIDTLVHELGHDLQHQRTKQAEDLAPAHAEAMTQIASRVVEEVSNGKFDELLKEVSW